MSIQAWHYASKRLDPELNLIYYGKRYYDPVLGRWLTTDPAGFWDSANLYQYVLNNPFRYRDPDGQFVFAIPLLILGAELVVPSLTAVAIPIIYGAITGAVAYGGYKAVQALNEKHDDTASWKNKDVNGRDGHSEIQPNSLQEGKQKNPPYSGKKLGKDPTKCPGEGFEWKGQDPPGGKRGSWYNKSKGISLHPDIDHLPPKQSHWDYTGPHFPKGARLNIDGTWEPKQ